MFGYVLENVWGPKRFLIFYFVTGIGAALVHYVIFYFQINPEVVFLDSIIANPSLDNLELFVNKLNRNVLPISLDSPISTTAFNAKLNAFGNNPNDPALIEWFKGTIIDYKIYFLNLPNVIGASGAVFGILLAFGMMFPNTLLYIYFLFPIKAKWFVLFYGALELYLGFTQSDSNVAHFAHLGGMVFGYFLIIYWKRKGIY
jgi:membrane associated rhomboid family serine protease